MQNFRVKEYFKNRPNDLLVINLSEKNSMKQIYEFLGVKYSGEAMPHLNRSATN